MSTNNHSASPLLWVLLLAVQLAQQPHSCMTLASWEQGVTDAWGHSFKWQNPSLFCLHQRTPNITPVPDFLHQKGSCCPVPLRLLCVFGLVKGKKILLFAIIFCVGIEQDF